MFGSHSIEYAVMEVSQVYLNGHRFLQDKRPLMLGISPGNPYYYKKETLERLFDFAARKNPDQVSYFNPRRVKNVQKSELSFPCFTSLP